MTRAFLAFIFGICLIAAAAALSPSNNVIIALPHKHAPLKTLQTLTLSSNSFTVGLAHGTFVSFVQNTTTGSTVTFNNLSVANSLQLVEVAGIWQIQVGSAAPGTPSTITFNLVETLQGASPHTTSGLVVNENAVTAFDPSNPAASGYALVFDDEFTTINTIDINNTQATGYKWYPGNFLGNGGTPASDIQVSGGELVLLDDTSGFGQGLSTAGPSTNADGFVGRAFGGGAYYEARIKFVTANINPNAGTIWPSFWTDSLEAWVHNSLWNAQWPNQATGYDNFVEDDIMEDPFGNAGFYNGSIHNWYSTPGACGGGWYCDSNNDGGSSLFNNNYVQTPGADLNQFHTYGQLWVAGNAANGGHGFVQYYFDGVASANDKVTWVDGIGSPPPQNQPWQFSVMDNQHMVVVLGTGHNNMQYTVNWVHIWQIPGQGTCVGSNC